MPMTIMVISHIPGRMMNNIGICEVCKVKGGKSLQNHFLDLALRRSFCQMVISYGACNEMSMTQTQFAVENVKILFALDVSEIKTEK